MSDEQTTKHVRELRARGLSPNEIAQIAHSFGIKPAIVSDLVRKLAAERDDSDVEHVDCLLNAGWSTGLEIDGHPD